MKTILLLASVLSLSTAWAKKEEIKFNNLNDLEKCAQSNSYDTSICVEPLQKYVKQHPNEAFAAGQMATRHFQHWVALEFFVGNGKNKLDAKTCSEKTFQMAMTSALSQPEEQPQHRLAAQVLQNNCWKEMTAALTKEMSDIPNSAFKGAVCPIAAKQGTKFEPCSKTETAAAPAPAEKLPTVDKNAIKLHENVKVYAGPEGEQMTMAQIEGTDLYLTKFSKVKGDWNNKIVLHKMDTRSPDSADIWTESKGKPWVTIAQRWGTYVVTLPGQQQMNFYYDKGASQAMKAQDLLNEYKKQ